MILVHLIRIRIQTLQTRNQNHLPVPSDRLPAPENEMKRDEDRVGEVKAMTVKRDVVAGLHQVIGRGVPGGDVNVV